MRNGIPKESKLFPLDWASNSRRLLLIGLTSFAVSLSLMVNLSPWRFIGGALIAFVLLAILYRDIMRYRPTYLNNFNMLLLLGLMIVNTLLIGRFFDYLLLNLSKA